MLIFLSSGAFRRMLREWVSKQCEKPPINSRRVLAQPIIEVFKRRRKIRDLLRIVAVLRVFPERLFLRVVETRNEEISLWKLLNSSMRNVIAAPSPAAAFG